MRIVAAMNGIGPEDAVGEYASKERICRCIINFAGNLHDDGVAPIHAFFEERDDGTFYVHDLDTETGTFVRGQRIDAPARLDDGDEVRFGSTTVVATHEEPTEAGLDEPAVEISVPPEPPRRASPASSRACHCNASFFISISWL